MKNVKTVLILGGNSRLGQCLQTFLSECCDVYITTRKSRPKNILKSIGWYYFDIDCHVEKNFRFLIDSIVPDVIVNCLAVTSDRVVSSGSFETYFVNALFPAIQSRVVRESGIDARIILISTDAVFSGYKGDYSEIDSPDPTCVYGLSKVLGEVYGDRIIVIRTSFFGFSEDKRGLVEWVISNEGKMLDGYTNYIFSGISVSKLCSYILIVIEKLTDFSGILNIGGEKFSKFELISQLVDIFNLNISVNAVADNPVFRNLDCTKFFELIDMKVPTLEESLSSLAHERLRCFSSSRENIDNYSAGSI